MLRRLLAPLVILGLAALALGDPAPKPADPQKPAPKATAPPTIYRIGEGKRYHVAGCPEENKAGAILKAITPAQAQAANLTPCERCDPPPLDKLAPPKTSDPKPADPKPADPAKPADPKAAAPAKAAAAALTVFRVGKGTHYHLQSCPICNPKGRFIGNPLTMAEVAKLGLIPCEKCDPPARKPSITHGKVILVKDADTFMLELSDKTKEDVRLEGIDAPETKPKQAFSEEAMAALSGKLLDKEVKVEWLQRDRDERILGHVYLGERWINLEMVAEGFAWHFTKYSKDKRLADAEKAARAACVGLWKDKNAISPDDFRARKKAKEPAH
jgi:endonuclease YncB( thermonuclease family)